MVKSRYLAAILCQTVVQILLLLVHDVIVIDTYSQSVWLRVASAPFTFAVFTKYALPVLDIALIINLVTLLIDVIYLLGWILPANSLAAGITSALIVIVQYSIIQNTIELKKSHKRNDKIRVPSLVQLRGITIPFGTATFLLAIFSGQTGLTYALRLVIQLDAFITHLTANKTAISVKLFEAFALILDIACIMITFEEGGKQIDTVPLLIEHGADIFVNNLRSTLTVVTLIVSLPCYIVSILNILN